MTFLIDAQLPHRLAAVLTEAGHPSMAVRDVGLREAEDDAIWDYAAENGSCIITKDEDFANRTWQATTGPTIVWLRIGNCNNQELLDRFLPLLEEIVSRIEAGDRLIEIR